MCIYLECCVVCLFRAAHNLDSSTWEWLSRLQGIKLIILSRIHLVIWICYINIVWSLIRGEISVLLISYSVLLLQPTGRLVPDVEQELLTLLDHMISPPVVSGVRVARSLVFEMFCRSLFVLCLLAIVLSVLHFKVSDYPFGIFKLLVIFLIVFYLYFYIPVVIKTCVPTHTRTCISIWLSFGLFVFNDLKWDNFSFLLILVDLLTITV